MNQIVSKLWAALERFLYFLVVRMAHIHMPEERWQGFLQFVKFVLNKFWAFGGKMKNKCCKNYL